ncbi:MAG: P-loop NTPase [Rhodothermales bacterium]|nr:P-loop NTPase [Rhodothermales bacterium]MBO6780437.1 P-loop NTPase [Rhodothermales bacterium]
MRDRTPHEPTVLAVVSGKGGVGKSLLAVNLAVTWSREGRSVALVDADAGQGSCAYLLGHSRSVSLIAPPEGLHDQDEALSLLDLELARARTAYDLVVIDAPAGIGPGVRWAMDRADASLLVLVDEPTAAADAYALCKLVWTRDPAYPLAGAVNMADSEIDAGGVISRFSALTTHFLDRKILYAGWVPFSGTIRSSVRQQIPAVLTDSHAEHAFVDLARRVRCGVFQTLAPLAMN